MIPSFDHGDKAAMDSFRGSFGLGNAFDEDAYAQNAMDEDIAHDAPPPSIGQDERRMQVRAYNHWASLLGNKQFPSIEDLVPENLPDFGPHSVLLDFTSGIENPGIAFLGAALAEECGHNDEIRQLSDIPGRSLLSRITDHYMQIMANQAPIGFEAEFVNDRGLTILYRGILLPFSSDDDTIDFIYGVINWKELADQLTTDALMEEIDRALGDTPSTSSEQDETAMDKEMPDAPHFGMFDRVCQPVADTDEHDDEDEDILDLGSLIKVGPRNTGSDMPEVGFGLFAELVPSSEEPISEQAISEQAISEQAGSWHIVSGQTDEAGFAGVSEDPWGEDEWAEEDAYAAYEAETLDVSSVTEAQAIPPEPEAMLEPDTMGLGDWLASARELAWAAHASEDRTRQALYAAIGRAYDFALAAAEAPEDYAELVVDAGLKIQDRAPMTPVVKLVFGTDYDKTRLTEFAAALNHGLRLGLARGTFATHLGQADGGLKAIVATERRMRREESGKEAQPSARKRDKLVRSLRALDARPLATIAPEGEEFALVMIRRMPDGAVAMLGEIADDEALVERAARKLVA